MQLDIKEVKTLYSIYKVIYQKKVVLDGKEKHGMIDYSHNLFKISTHNSIKNQLETIIHEYLHATERELNIELEESKLNMLANTLFKFIQENPDLVEIILECRGEKV